MLNCMICGVGGQGTVLASKLLAAAAMDAGLSVRTTETIGMAQRGGSVVSHVRMGETIFSPLIPLKQADIIIAFEPAEAVRALPYLREDGMMLVCDSAIKPVTDALSGGAYQAADMLAFLMKAVPAAKVLNGARIIEQCGVKALNVALLGAALKTKLFPFGTEAMANVIRNKLPEKFQAMNLNALHLGGDMYEEQ